tara:strand:+ start:2551 stop:3495 length:945 start_codon:yes stop_codon:yes gene_type:complete
MNKLLFLILLFISTNIKAADDIKLSLDWVPQGEHGGFFQAIAKGYYNDVDINLEIIPGGPSVNTKAMLMSEQVDFNIGGSAGALNYAKQDLPFTAVAAFFQKTPQVLISHPNVGIDHPSDFVGKTIFLSNFGRLSFWGFIKNKYNLSDDQLKSYNFNSQPFIDDPQSIQQGYLSSEPFAIKKTAGFEPVVHLLADYGFNAYANTIETSDKLIKENPDLIRRFIKASRLGWEDYLTGDTQPAFDLIQELNPDMPSDKLAYAHQKMIEYNIVTGNNQIIGSMSANRWQSFYEMSVELGIYDSEFDYEKAYTLEFSN